VEYGLPAPYGLLMAAHCVMYQRNVASKVAHWFLVTKTLKNKDLLNLVASKHTSEITTVTF